MTSPPTPKLQYLITVGANSIKSLVEILIVQAVFDLKPHPVPGVLPCLDVYTVLFSSRAQQEAENTTHQHQTTVLQHGQH